MGNKNSRSSTGSIDNSTVQTPETVDTTPPVIEPATTKPIDVDIVEPTVVEPAAAGAGGAVDRPAVENEQNPNIRDILEELGTLKINVVFFAHGNSIVVPKNEIAEYTHNLTQLQLINNPGDILISNPLYKSVWQDINSQHHIGDILKDDNIKTEIIQYLESREDKDDPIIQKFIQGIRNPVTSITDDNGDELVPVLHFTKEEDNRTEQGILLNINTKSYFIPAHGEFDYNIITDESHAIKLFIKEYENVLRDIMDSNQGEDITLKYPIYDIIPVELMGFINLEAFTLGNVSCDKIETIDNDMVTTLGHVNFNNKKRSLRIISQNTKEQLQKLFKEVMKLGYLISQICRKEKTDRDITQICSSHLYKTLLTYRRKTYRNITIEDDYYKLVSILERFEFILIKIIEAKRDKDTGIYQLPLQNYGRNPLELSLSGDIGNETIQYKRNENTNIEDILSSGPGIPLKGDRKLAMAWGGKRRRKISRRKTQKRKARKGKRNKRKTQTKKKSTLKRKIK